MIPTIVDQALDYCIWWYYCMSHLWDGAFPLAQTVGPMEQDTKTYLRYVLAAVHGNNALGCTVTPKDAQAHRVSNEIYSGGVGR